MRSGSIDAMSTVSSRSGADDGTGNGHPRNLLPGTTATLPPLRSSPVAAYISHDPPQTTPAKEQIAAPRRVIVFVLLPLLVHCERTPSPPRFSALYRDAGAKRRVLYLFPPAEGLFEHAVGAEIAVVIGIPQEGVVGGQEAKKEDGSQACLFEEPRKYNHASDCITEGWTVGTLSERKMRRTL